MKILIQFILAVCVALSLTSCWSVEHSRTAYREHFGATLGEDTMYEMSAQSFTRGENSVGGAPTVILNPQGTKILAVIPSDPLAGMLTGTDVSVKWGKNQSNGFRAFLRTVSTVASGLFAQQTASDYVAGEVAKTQSANKLAATVAGEETKRATIKVGSKLAEKVPAEEAAGALGGVLGR